MTNPTETSKLLHFPNSIDSTMLSAFDSCPQKFFQEFILCRVPIGRSVHLHAGGCFASALENVRRDYFFYGMPFKDCLEDTFEKFTIEWGDFEIPVEEDSYKDFPNMWGALVAYFREYPIDRDPFQPVINDDGSPAVEFRFAIPMDIQHPITEDPLLFSGRADQVSINQGSVYIQDEKTTKALGKKWPYQWDMRGQFYGYTHAARQYGYPAVGALIRGICIQQTQYGFAEKPLLFTDWQLDQWWTMAQRKVRNMVRMWEVANAALQVEDLRGMHDAWDQSFGEACTQYGGCWFTDLCQNEQPWNIYRTYEERIWDPLAKDPTEKSENRMAEMSALDLMEASMGL